MAITDLPGRYDPAVRAEVALGKHGTDLRAHRGICRYRAGSASGSHCKTFTEKKPKGG
jgi:hypothetical protein